MTIAEVSKRCDITADTLRYYERIGLIPAINRNTSGIREYTEEDCNWIQFIKCMRNAGLSIEILIEYLNMLQKGNSTVKARKELLMEQRSQLAVRIEEMQGTLERLDMKIDRYEDIILVNEEHLKRSDE